MDCPDPDNLVPWPVQGFESLEARHKSQDSIVTELIDRVRLLQAKLREMSLFYATELRGSFEKIRQNRIRIHQELLSIIETEELRRGQGRAMSRDEFDVLKELEATNNEHDHPGRFRDVITRLDQESEREDLERRLPFTIRPDIVAAMTKVVQMDQEAIEALEAQVKRMRKIVREWERVWAKRVAIECKTIIP
jgi:hypothetical protein